MLLAAGTARRSDFADLDMPDWAWPALLAVLAVMLAVDLLRHRDDHAPTTGEALWESITWVACALLFAGVVAVAFGRQAFGEYISGYLIEKSLSIDNVFVWALLLTTMAIPLRLQHRVLFWGVFGALALGAMYTLLAGARDRFPYLSYALGGILVFVGLKMTASRWVHVNTYLSLAVMVCMLAGAVFCSLARPRANEAVGRPPHE